MLDPALVRPGRFDRQVFVSLPDLQGRYEILKVHMKKIKLGPNVDLRRCARSTPMFSGAELAAIVNESALLATMTNKEYVEQEDIEEARDKIRWGRAKKSAVVDERDRKLTAYHEAGHALIQALEKEADPLHKVSIIPRGPTGGATYVPPGYSGEIIGSGPEYCVDCDETRTDCYNEWCDVTNNNSCPDVSCICIEDSQLFE